MHSNKGKLILILVSVLILGFTTLLHSRSVKGGSGGDKRLDIFHWHNVGNIWMRISNYGFFGSGDDVTPQWPSLEYPGGSGIDYLYQGSIWFGAVKQRRNEYDQKLYWQDEEHSETGATNMGFGSVMDTLCSVGFDGDADMYEFLPAYNQLEENALGPTYDMYNMYDGVLKASIREQKLGVDDDGDGKIDEDPAGFAFPFRSTIPEVFKDFIDPDSTQVNPEKIQGNIDIWFPLGFLKLGYIDPDSLYDFARPQDDDNDGLKDEDGYPMSEQDFLGYYYDYSPFDTPGHRIWGGWQFGQTHTPINARVRQVSFQWSYEYIKNLVYVEFDITNMNPDDTLYDCAMGVYMDCDVGPQSWGGDPRSLEDISSYVSGEGYEFAYTFDADKDGGLTTGFIGARVCTPDPEQLEFACWTWKRGDGPRDGVSGERRNEKYWLMTHNTEPFDDKFVSLREFPETQMDKPVDTRFLFAFYGDMQGIIAPTDSSWNLAPYETMKIVIAIFPGEDVEELKRTALWAKTIYGEAQTLTTVIMPDTFKHYEAPGPPDSPKMTLTQAENGDSIFVYWDNRSEFTIDNMTVSKGLKGWQTENPFLDSYIDKYHDYFPEEFAPWDSAGEESNRNINALLNPWTANRLRHDFQGYSLWLASNSGEQDAFMRIKRWDKTDTPRDLRDYNSCLNLPPGYEDFEVDFGGYLGRNIRLPQEHIVEEKDTIYTIHGDTIRWTHYFQLDSLYLYDSIGVGDIVYGTPLYAADVDSSIVDSSSYIDCNGDLEKEALLFKNPNISDDIYLTFIGVPGKDDALIPLPYHLGQHHPCFSSFAEMRKARLARRYYKYTITYPEKGVESYIAVTAYDRGIPDKDLQSLESGRDANRITIFPGPSHTSDMDKIYVVPNPYLGQSKFDGRREKDEKGDRSKRIWFVNLPKYCTIKIFTLAGDLVDEIKHSGEYEEDVINPSKATHTGITSSGSHSWDMLSKNDQIIASGVYLYSVKDHDTGNVKVDKFVLIK